MSPRLVAVLGPTGSGKTEFAEALADRTGAVLVNADAFQVYCGLDIGTSKPADRARYELLDILEPWQSFGVGEYVRLAAAAISKHVAEGRNVIVVGGTGLYVRALFEQWSDLAEAPSDELRAQLMQLESEQGLQALVDELHRLDPTAADKVDRRNPVRVRRALERLVVKDRIRFKLPDVPRVKFGLSIPQEVLDTRLAERLDHMLNMGWIDEVIALRAKGIGKSAPAMRAIGYSYILRFLNNELSRTEVRERILMDTRRYAKRQRTWMRTEPNLIPIEMMEGLQASLDLAMARLAE
ncbi:MAG: tRNA dimethylallyltransferase [Fimbriimonadaceae bacterium]|nr:tRNA dimethylallyltransferase [Fimbriimonadaceae bacterium]